MRTVRNLISVLFFLCLTGTVVFANVAEDFTGGAIQEEVKATSVNLASEETLGLLQTNWLKEIAATDIAVDKTPLTAAFWLLAAIVVGLVVLGTLFSRSRFVQQGNLALKLLASHGSLAVLALALGLSAYFYLHRLVDISHLETVFQEIDLGIQKINVAQNEFLLHGIENRSYGDLELKHAKEQLAATDKQAADLSQQSLVTAHERQQLEELRGALSKYREDLAEVDQAYHEIIELKDTQEQLGIRVTDTLEALLAHHEAVLFQLENQGDDLEAIKRETALVEHLAKLETLFLKTEYQAASFLLDKNVRHVNAMVQHMGSAFGYVKVISGELSDAQEQARLRQVEEAMTTFQKSLETMIKDEAILLKDTAEMRDLLHTAEVLSLQLTADAEARLQGLQTEADIAAIIMMVLALFIGATLAIRMSRALSRPMIQMSEAASQIALGNVNQTIDYQSQDEIGSLAQSFRDMNAYIQEVADLAHRLSLGDVTVQARPKSDQDVLSQSFNETIGYIREVADASTMLGRGDMSVQVTPKSDQDTLSQSFNASVQGMREVMASITQNAQALSASSQELSASSQQMASNAEETAAQASTVSSASEQVSQNVVTVANGSEELSTSIQEIAQSANEAARVALSAVQKADVTNTTIAKLGDSSNEIGNVIKVITSIAEQTNLLALNATIEAARAGEAGKGFAVVANEVKELAKETANATEDIGRRIEAIQLDSQGAIEAISEISTVIGQINDIQTSIASAVEQQGVTTNAISHNVGEAAKSTASIVRSIGGVAEAAQSTTAGTTSTQRAASDLATMAAELQNLVARFKFEGDGTHRAA